MKTLMWLWKPKTRLLRRTERLKKMNQESTTGETSSVPGHLGMKVTNLGLSDGLIGKEDEQSSIDV